jgi:hypothetical protein
MVRTHGRFIVVLKAVGATLFLFGFFGWMNGEVVQFTHQEWLPTPISRVFLPWMRLDTFTILSFIVSGIGFFMWMLGRELKASSS